jgi:CRISPR system Cascade subunit CasC
MMNENEGEGIEAESNSEKSDTLLFLSPNEVAIIADAFAAKGFEQNKTITQKDQKKQAKEIADLIGTASQAIDALDIALFGRMVAQAADLNVEAAASFSHAISTHKVSNEVEFFTALDDCATEPGSAHMGSLEFNSATYYRYVSLDLGQLWQTLAGQNLAEAVENFTKALFVAVPAARQATQSGASPWEFAKVLVRKGQRLQVPFETAVKAKDKDGGGFLQPSIEAMSSYLARQEKLHGSLFGKQAEYTYGQDDGFSIDDLIARLRGHCAISSAGEEAHA